MFYDKNYKDEDDETEDENYCEICGRYSGEYSLCRECYYEQYYEDDENEEEDCYKENDITTCLTCNEEKENDGYLFCKDCYSQYKNKVLRLEIRHCKEVEIIDSYFEGRYECEDGHIVKSIAEQTIDNWLYSKGILHGYETPLNVDAKKPLKPDFCLKNFLGEGQDVYIEHFGLKGDSEYDKETAYKMPLYKKKGITLICMYPQTDGKNLTFALQTKLKDKPIQKNKINYEE